MEGGGRGAQAHIARAGSCVPVCICSDDSNSTRASVCVHIWTYLCIARTHARAHTHTHTCTATPSTNGYGSCCQRDHRFGSPRRHLRVLA